MSAPALEVRNLTKRFPGVQALDGADFSMATGAIHALVGANGAGKSTLIKILAGIEHPDSGEILIDGQTVTIKNPEDSRRHGLAFIHQELALVGRMTVAENLMLAALPSRMGVVRVQELKRMVSVALHEFLPTVSPDVRVDDLTVAQQWLVSLSRVSLENARVVFLDEPTAALGAHEVQLLFDVVRRLAASGIAIVFVSHRLPEVLEIASSVTALRSGRRSGVHPIAEVDHAKLVELISGAEPPTAHVAEISDHPGEVIMEVRHLHSGPIHDISFQLRAGEVLGVGGLVGSGRSELLEALFGARPITHGTITLDGRDVRFRSPADAVKHGVAMLPEDRREMALLHARSICVNTVLAHLPFFASRWLRMSNRSREAAATQSLIERLGIRTTGSRQLVNQLSGGNQQKVVVARWLCREVRVFLVDEPTKGVDVGGKAEILRTLRELAANGVAVMIVSSELEEVAAVSDRVIALREGRLVAELPGPVTENAILQACFDEIVEPVTIL